MRPVLGLPISGIIMDTQVMFLNAWVTSLEVYFVSLHILTDLVAGNFGFWRVSWNPGLATVMSLSIWFVDTVSYGL